MAEAKTPLAAIHDEFGRARGEDMDSTWAFGVSWSLMMRDVDADLVLSGLKEALVVVDQTQESPEELFGTPAEHAAALYDQWHSEGRLVLVDSADQTWPEAVRWGVGLSAAYAAVFAVVLLFRGDLAETTNVVRVLLISLTIGMGSTLGHAAWSRRHRRSVRGNDVPADMRWSVELTEILRTRYHLSGSRVRDIVADAHVHAAESGSTVQEEFGTPTEYAARFAPDRARRSGWTTVLLLGLTVSNLVLLVDGFSWPHLGLLAGFGWMALAEYRRYRDLRDQSGR